MPHRVRRIACRVAVGDARQALSWRRALRTQADAAWPQAIDSVLEAAAERLALGECTLHLRRLDLRLAPRDAAELAEALPRALQAALARWQVEGEALPDAALPGVLGAPIDTPPLGVAARSPAETARDALAHVLATGRLPWDWESFDGAVVASRLQAAARSLLEEVQAAPAAARPTLAPLQVLRWAAWLDVAALDRVGVPPLPSGVTPRVAMPTAWPPSATVAQRLRQWLNHAPDPAPTERHAEDRAGDATPTALQPAPAGPMPTNEMAPTAAEAAPNHRDARSDAASASPAFAAAPPPERWHARDAGLVLLHPFLPRLFEACGLIGPDARRIDAARRPQAAALLHWLATGREGAFEHELTLAKLLVGVGPEEPLLPAPSLAPEWVSEGQALLGAAIAHWGALGATGVDGLRLSFLCRQGLLWRGEAAWCLRVAPEAFDVLLARLPWALSFIRLPWMPAALAVQWDAP